MLSNSNNIIDFFKRSSLYTRFYYFCVFSFTIFLSTSLNLTIKYYYTIAYYDVLSHSMLTRNLQIKEIEGLKSVTMFVLYIVFNFVKRNKKNNNNNNN